MIIKATKTLVRSNTLSHRMRIFHNKKNDCVNSYRNVVSPYLRIDQRKNSHGNELT